MNETWLTEMLEAARRYRDDPAAGRAVVGNLAGSVEDLVAEVRRLRAERAGDRDSIRKIAAELNEDEAAIKDRRLRLQSLCQHPAFITAYETADGDREGLSGEYIDTCTDCGRKEPTGELAKIQEGADAVSSADADRLARRRIAPVGVV